MLQFQHILISFLSVMSFAGLCSILDMPADTLSPRGGSSQ